MNSNKISQGAIKTLLKFNFEEKTFNVDFNLQIIYLKYVEQPENKQITYQMGLSDNENQCKHFICQTQKKDEFKIYDMIKIKKICVSVKKREEKTNIVFLLNSENITCLGNPGKMLYEGSTNLNSDAFYNKGNKEQEINFSMSNTNSNAGNNKYNNINNGAKNEPKNKGFPLSALSTFSKDFTIVVRCSKKNTMKTYNNAKGPGNLFSFLVIDSDAYEMEVLSFGQTATNLYQLIEEGKVYQIEGTYVKIAGKKFTSVKSDYTLHCSDNVKVVELKDDSTIKNYSFSFTKIADIKNLASDSLVDIFGKVMELGEKTCLQTKFGNQDLRKAIVADDSNTQIEVSFWRDSASKVNFDVGDYVVLKAVKVNEFNGSKKLNFSDLSILVVNPAIPEKVELELFFNSGEERKFNSLVGEKNYDIEKINFLGKAIDALYSYSDDTKLPLFKVKAFIMPLFHSEKNFYHACKECKKKIQDEQNYMCGSCGKKNSEPNFVYILSMRIRDATSEFYVDMFGDVAERLLGISCNDYRKYVMNQDYVKLDSLNNKVCYKEMLMVVSPKVHMFNQEIKRKLTVLRFENVEQAGEIKRIFNILDLFPNDTKIQKKIS